MSMYVRLHDVMEIDVCAEQKAADACAYGRSERQRPTTDT